MGKINGLSLNHLHDFRDFRFHDIVEIESRVAPGFRKKQNLEIEICALTRQLRHYGRGGSDSRGVGRLKSCSAYLSMSALACWLIFSPYAPHWRLWRDVMSTNFEVLPVRCSETHCHQAPGARTAGVEAPSSRGLLLQHARC